VIDMNPYRANYTGLFLAVLILSSNVAHAQYLRVRDICRVKGQEENTLHGLGLVVGLQGTGDTDGPTVRALAKMLELMGNPVGQQLPGGGLALQELKNAKNVAMVFVSATVPPEGARQGEQLNCTVNAVSAKSLAGGHLMMTPLVGPRPGQPRIYAIAQGPIAMNASGPPTAGVIHDGCRLEEEFAYKFTDHEGKVTLVIDRNHASFPTAEAIQKAINGRAKSTRNSDSASAPYDSTWGDIAQAVDPVTVEVRIPPEYQNQVVEFFAMILDNQVAIQSHDARVVVNERNGVIVIGDNVMIGRVAVTHKNITLETGGEATDKPLKVVDQAESSSTTRLQALVNALNDLKVGPQDIIDIIKSLERSGDLYGKLIIE
jgi:flagellar P-ring protein precursor FlgI